jgi:hypothetical protein
MKAKPRELPDVKPASPDELPWSPRARAIASVLIAAHVFALFVAPWSMPPPASDLAGVCAGWLRPYLHAAFIYHGYRFFAPDPGASHIVRYELEFADGRIEKGQFPDLQRHWPRLLYHRFFMLSETIYQATGIPPAPPPPPPNVPPRFKQRVRAEYEEALQQYQQSVKSRDALVDAVAQRLLLDSGAAKVRLWAVEHTILSPQQVLDGMPLTQEETYIQRPLGEFTSSALVGKTP